MSRARELADQHKTLNVDGGTIKLDGNYPTGTNNVALGNTALDDGSLSGANNTAIGSAAMTAHTSGNNNTAVGHEALTANTTGFSNVTVGGRSLDANTTGAQNTALGYQALSANTTASNNVAVGYGALGANTTGAQNVAVGTNAGDAITTASNCTLIGHNAGGAVVGGTNTTAIGYNAGDAITNQVNNVMLGVNAGTAATSDANTFIGTGAGELITTGAKNAILGRYNGNQGGLDIRTANNHIVLSDGDGNPRQAFNGSGQTIWGNDMDGFNGFLSLKWNAPSYVGFTMQNTNTTTGGALFRFFNSSGGNVGQITTNNSVTTYSTSSDYRLKENVVGMTGATTRLKQLNPVRFNFIADADTTVDGFLAHEVQLVVPEAVEGTYNEVDDDGNPVYQGIDQSKLVPLLVATIQELEARIATLEGAN